MCTRYSLAVVVWIACATAAVQAGWGDPLQYDQLTPVDSRAGESWRDGSQSHYYLCADDFVSTEEGRISEVRVRGIDDAYNFGVEVMFWANVPATATTDSHPGELLYTSGRLPVADPGDPNLYGWYDVGNGEFRITLPEFHRFHQQGTPECPVVYWVGVQVYHDVFGWEKFYWNFRQPGYQDGGGAVYSIDGETWSHWGQNQQGTVTTYDGTLPTGWQPVDMTFQLYSGVTTYNGPIANPSFEVEWAGTMPNGGWLAGPPYAGMPDAWGWRGVGAVNGHGEAYIDAPEWNWVSDGDFALYLFAHRFEDHYPADHLQFYQRVDLTGVEAIWFDAYIRQNFNDCKAYMSVDGRDLWSDNAVEVHLNRVIDVRDYVGVHELALGVRVSIPFGQDADGHTYFDNLRAVGVGDMDGDLDIDADDLDLHAACMLGPDLPSPSGCEGANLDADADADLRDFGVLQRNATGPLAEDE